LPVGCTDDGPVAAGTGAMAGGHTPLEEARRNDEIGDLARAFERVSISLRTSFESIPSQRQSAQ